MQLRQVVALTHGDEDVAGGTNLVEEGGERLVNVDEARRRNAGFSQGARQDAVQLTGLGVRRVDDQVDPVVAVDRHREHARGGQPRLGHVLFRAPHGQGRQVRQLRGRGQRAGASLAQEHQHEAGEDADDGENQDEASLGGLHRVARGVSARNDEAGAGVVRLQLSDLLLELVDLLRHLVGARVLRHLAVLVDGGLQGPQLGLQGGDVLVRGGGHLVGALLHEGCALLQVELGNRVRGRDGLGAGRRRILDLHDRAIRVARHVHVGAQLGSGHAAAELLSRRIQDRRRLRDALLGDHVRRIRQRGAHDGSRSDSRRRDGHRHRRRVR